MIKLKNLDRQEALRYLGIQNKEPDANTALLLKTCEKELLQAAAPSYIYRCFSTQQVQKGVLLPDCGLLLTGNDIKTHLDGCQRAVLLCATISAAADKLIRRAQVQDMAKAVVLDSLASVAVEQLCNKLDLCIAREFPQYYKTWRFSPGYGDLPIQVQPDLLNALDAPRKTGVCASESCMLTPAKSVTAIIGLSKTEIARKNRSCGDCNLNGSCVFRKAGERCV